MSNSKNLPAAQAIALARAERNPTAGVYPRATALSLALAMALTMTTLREALTLEGPPPCRPIAGDCALTAVRLATHPDARRQRTRTGRTLARLIWHEGLLYAGYGDYGANTGPIHLRTLHPAAAYFSPTMETLDTEAVYQFTAQDGALLIPNIDPRGSVGPGVFIGDVRGWTASPDMASTHVFDLVSEDSDTLWLLGAAGRDAAIWRWAPANGTLQQIVTPARRADAAFVRATGGFIWKGRLCVYFQQVAASGETAMRCLSDPIWQSGPTVFGDDASFADMAMTRPTRFAGGILYTDTHTGVSQVPSRLYHLPLDAVDGPTSRDFRYAFGPQEAFEDPTRTAYIRDFYVDDNRLWILNARAEIWHSTDLKDWRREGYLALPRGERAASIAVHGETLFVGTDRAQVYRIGAADQRASGHPSLQ